MALIEHTLTLEEQVIETLKKYDFTMEYINTTSMTHGIGDILFTLLMIQERQAPPTVFMNMKQILNHAFPNPINALDMRAHLIKDILTHHETLPTDTIRFVKSENMGLVWYDSAEKLRTLRSLHLNMKPSFLNDVTPSCDISDEYIVFHTKLRLNRKINYDQMKSQVHSFCSSFKSKYKIILLGERTFPDNTFEGKIHGITTIYNELLQLKKNNDIIDLTVETIYNNVDYNMYKKDLLTIARAKYNICIGEGGQLCTSLTFGTTLACPLTESKDKIQKKGTFHTIFDTLPEIFLYIINNLSID